MSDLNKYKNIIDEPPMITTELYPWKLEINGDVIRLLAADGKPVVTCVADSATNTLNVLAHNDSLFAVTIGRFKDDLLTLVIMTVDILVNLTLVLADQTVCSLHNQLGRTVVLLQFKQPCICI